jgi:hypothetical protein
LRSVQENLEECLRCRSEDIRRVRITARAEQQIE